MQIGHLLATSDKEMGKIDPSPKGCDVNYAVLCCRPRLGMAKAFVLRLRGPHRQVLVDGVGSVRRNLRSQRRPLLYVDTTWPQRPSGNLLKAAFFVLLFAWGGVITGVC
jgi:hypothetical protein